MTRETMNLQWKKKVIIELVNLNVVLNRNLYERLSHIWKII